MTKKKPWLDGQCFIDRFLLLTGSLQLKPEGIRFLHDVHMADRGMGSVDAAAGDDPRQHGLPKAVHPAPQAMTGFAEGALLVLRLRIRQLTAPDRLHHPRRNAQSNQFSAI